MNKFLEHIIIVLSLVLFNANIVTAQDLNEPLVESKEEFVLRNYDKEAMERYKNDPTLNPTIQSGSIKKSTIENTTLESDEDDRDRISNGESRPWSSTTEVREPNEKVPETDRGKTRTATPERKERKKEKVEIDTATGIGLNLNWIWIILAAIVLFFIIAYFMGLKPNSFNKVANEEENIVATHQDINDIKFETELEKAIRTGNYKLAVRILYLESLKGLNDRAMIHWVHNKTNWDYLNELKADDAIKSDFKQLTLAFDYVWYGDFKLSENDFKIIQSQFNKFKTHFTS